MIVDNRELENIYNLKPGYIAMIVLKRGDIYIGTVDHVDYCDNTITLINGYVYQVTVVGQVQKYFNVVTLNEDDVLCCIDKKVLVVYKNDKV